MSTAEASCYCGQVRFSVDPPAKFVAHCHCENCRRAHGAGFVTWCGFLKEQFRITAGEQALGHYVSETNATRSFCKVCGTPMFFESPRWPGEVHIAYALLDAVIDEQPQGHAYADRSPDWCPILDELPRYGGKTGVEPLTEKETLQ